MNLSYATIPTKDGKPFILYKEPHISKHVKYIMEQSNFTFNIDRGLEDENITNLRVSINDDLFPFHISPKEFAKEEDNLETLFVEDLVW